MAIVNVLGHNVFRRTTIVEISDEWMKQIDDLVRLAAPVVEAGEMLDDIHAFMLIHQLQAAKYTSTQNVWNFGFSYHAFSKATVLVMQGELSREEVQMLVANRSEYFTEDSEDEESEVETQEVEHPRRVWEFL